MNLAPAPTPFRQLLSKAGMSRAAFARLSGMDARTVERWRDDPPRWAYVLLEYRIALAQALWRDPVNQKAVGYEFRDE